MMNDKVREDLASRITPAAPQRLVPRAMPPVAEEERMAVTTRRAPAVPPATPSRLSVQPPVKRETADLVAPKTSPTLVEFQNKKAPLPDWRLKVQNAVQQRRGSDAMTGQPAPLRIGDVSLAETEPVAEQPKVADRRVENAMKRIAESRAAFLKPQPSPKKAVKPAPKPLPAPIQKQFPFDVVQASVPQRPATAAAPAPARAAAQSKAPQQPVAAPAPVIIEKVDTNKLPPLEAVIEPSPAPAVIKKVEPIEPVKEEPKTPAAEFTGVKRIRICVDNTEISSTIVEDMEEEIEDLAPFSMRFGAGLFDLIIGAFGGLLLISPIAFSTTEWFTISGLLAFTGAWALFLFLYMTICLGFYGKTLGMRLFALELVDAVENEYPTLRQAAVNSSVFILSLPLAGAGFITAVFNEEHRALHDLLSGTIQVREF